MCQDVNVFSLDVVLVLALLALLLRIWFGNRRVKSLKRDVETIKGERQHAIDLANTWKKRACSEARNARGWFAVFQHMVKTAKVSMSEGDVTMVNGTEVSARDPDRINCISAILSWSRDNQSRDVATLELRVLHDGSKGADQRVIKVSIVPVCRIFTEFDETAYWTDSFYKSPCGTATEIDVLNVLSQKYLNSALLS